MGSICEATDTVRGRIKPPGKFGVYLLNDDFTTMDFVVDILQTVFRLSEERAVAVMLLVHHEGKGLCGVYARDVALTKQQQVARLARKAGFPLQCSVEAL